MRVLERREEVIVRKEEAFNGAIEDNDLTSSSASSARMISLSCGIVSGPKY